MIQQTKTSQTQQNASDSLRRTSAIDSENYKPIADILEYCRSNAIFHAHNSHSLDMSLFMTTLRKKIYTVIFETDTTAGKTFDVVLIFCILLSVLFVMLDSIPDIHKDWGRWLLIGEWLITALFTAEYILRLYVVDNRRRYIFSFFGLVDLLAILPTYVSLFMPGMHFLITIRIMRILRIFRVFKLVQFVGEGHQLWTALKRSRHKIIVFLTSVLTVVVAVGSLMYLIEGSASGFTSIPKSIYWAIVTMTTVGYGDIAPKTALGQIVASLLMIIGYGIIAVPTGIVTSEIIRPSISREDGYCPCCGKKLDLDELHK